MSERPQIDEIRIAAERLRAVVARTPMVPLHCFDGNDDIRLKVEIHQPVTSFKLRGVFNAVSALGEVARHRGLSTVSAGNTAQALAWAARHFGVPARALMPDTAPRIKIDAVCDYGGEPVLVPVDELFRYLDEHGWEKEPYTFIHPWTNRDLMIGHGSMGLEIVDQAPDVETVYVPVGGGGLLGGVGSALRALRPEVRIVAVEPEGCPSLHESLRQGQPSRVECHTMCDGVAVPYITDEMFPVLREVADDCVLVSEDAVRAAVKRLALRNCIVAEGSGALAVAAALATPSAERGRAVCLVTGGSIDTPTLVGILSDPTIPG